MSLDRLTAALADRYRIERELGQGGMATVYLAEDLRHKRQVAIKVLRPELAAMLGADRFVQEITTTAALQHPHILPLFDSGESDGFLWYAMPFIDGETLRAKLDRESQLGVTEAVRIASEVADALDYAHRHGVVHRDIKPENILLHDGRPMVADFGIALALSAAAGGRMTETGMSLGTPHYMSPEQATAEKEVSNRSDIYSLGSVLYEMLAGQPPHLGGTAQQIIMKIIAEEAQPVTRLRKTVPPNVAAAVAKALEKLPADRFESARAFAEALADPHYAAHAGTTTAFSSAPGSRRLVGGLAAALVATMALAAWALLRQDPTPAAVSRYALSFPPSQAPLSIGFALVTSDGSAIIYVGPAEQGGSGFTQLWVKRRDALYATPIPGTLATSSATLSPDDAELAIVQGALLRRVSLSGGGTTQITDGVSNEVGAVTWLDDGTLLYLSAGRSAIMRVPEAGGSAEMVWSSDSLTPTNLTPLPDGRGALFQACRRPCNGSTLWALDLRTRKAHVIRPNARAGYYTSTGHLVFVRDGDFSALAAAFDLDRLEARGEPKVVIDSVSGRGGISAYLAISRNGTLVMRHGAAQISAEFELIRVDRTGQAVPVDSTWTFRNVTYAGNAGWAISPDGSAIAIGLSTGFGDDIWIKPLSRRAPTRVTYGSGAEFRPRWRPDGRHVTYVSETGLWLRRADGLGTDSLLLEGPFDEGLVSPDGEWLLFREGGRSPAPGFRDILGLRPGRDTAVVPIVKTEFDEMAIALSPDGRWLAYQSDETGKLQVYVRPFPDTESGRAMLSTDGGSGPIWSRDGRELYYLSASDTMMAVTIGEGPDLQVSAPRALFHYEANTAQLNARFYTPWDVGPDGRFILARAVAAPDARFSPLIVIENWFEELKARMAP